MPQLSTPRFFRFLMCAFVCTLWPQCFSATATPQADGPLLRAFKAGDVQHYRITLIVRSESDGHRPVSVESKTYAAPFADSAEASLSWEATRLVVSLEADGTAQMEEALQDFSTLRSVKREDAEGKASQTLTDSLLAWTRQLPPVLRYRETPAGQISGAGAEAAPMLDDAPAVLTLWLRRALRPSASLPNRAPREGERWSDPRAVRLPPWTEVRGTETGEWIAGPAHPPGNQLLTLHTVQQIAGGVPPAASDASPARPGTARFHAESLSAVAHLGAPAYGGYGSLYSATRSASREVTHVVTGIPNMPDAVFRTRLSVEVRIQLIE